MNKRTNSKENDTISKKTGNKARQLSIYFLQAISLIALLFCVWLLTREKEYREIDVNTVAQNLVELMPDTVVSESDMVVKSGLAWKPMHLMDLSTMDQTPIWMRQSFC